MNTASPIDNLCKYQWSNSIEEKTSIANKN